MAYHVMMAVSGVVVILIAFILIVIGTSTKGWANFSNINTGIGLQDGDDPQYKAAYALCIIACVGSAIALATASLFLLMKVISKLTASASYFLPLVTTIAATIGGLCGIAGSILHLIWTIIHYVDTTFTGRYSPGYSFYLTIIGSVLLMVGGSLVKRANKIGII